MLHHQDIESPVKLHERDCVQNEATILHESEASQIVSFMRDEWKLPIPELIISVTGGANSFKIPLPRVHNAFQQGLVSVAITTGINLFIDCNDF